MQINAKLGIENLERREVFAGLVGIEVPSMDSPGGADENTSAVYACHADDEAWDASGVARRASVDCGDIVVFRKPADVPRSQVVVPEIDGLTGPEIHAFRSTGTEPAGIWWDDTPMDQAQADEVEYTEKGVEALLGDYSRERRGLLLPAVQKFGGGSDEPIDHAATVDQVLADDVMAGNAPGQDEILPGAASTLNRPGTFNRLDPWEHAVVAQGGSRPTSLTGQDLYFTSMPDLDANAIPFEGTT